MSKPYYNGQLDNVDAFLAGQQLRNKHDKGLAHPTGLDLYLSEDYPFDQFTTTSEKDSGFLSDFSERFIEGYMARHKEIDRDEYIQKLNNLIVSLKYIDVNDLVLLKLPNQPDIEFKTRVEYLNAERNVVLLRYLEKTNVNSGNSKSLEGNYSYILLGEGQSLVDATINKLND